MAALLKNFSRAVPIIAWRGSSWVLVSVPLILSQWHHASSVVPGTPTFALVEAYATGTYEFGSKGKERAEPGMAVDDDGKSYSQARPGVAPTYTLFLVRRKSRYGVTWRNRRTKTTKTPVWLNGSDLFGLPDSRNYIPRY
jgi:hypothetical protein